MNTDKYNITEIPKKESLEINGGSILGGIAAGVIISMITNWSDIKNGASDAYSDAMEAYNQ